MARVMVAMSGGVDSSVAAALACESNNEVVGVTLRLWGGESDSGCCSVSDVDDARRAANALGIEHHVFNLGDDFDKHVVGPYVEAHSAGLTPNPCIECNRHIKFDRLLNRAKSLGFDKIVTGHHARITTREDGTSRIARAKDAAKDQSYVLYMLNQDQISSLHLPVGEMTKDQVREKANSLGLRVATKPDSQDVCFITREKGRADFLSKRIPLTPGRVIDENGSEVGQVEAIELVTVGQRKGMLLAGGKGPRYATSVDIETATVTVGTSEQLLVKVTEFRDSVWSAKQINGEFLVQTSAHGKPETASVQGGSLTWKEPHQKVASGQSVVFYEEDQVVGGAIAI
ncbi:MAG: tRNA 2-thiouridine(34) synthase MnmA [Acidimicrobiaceae bacterium]|nr:tRNA 2-thiouridine(34) synthase MnmA [Acidimicrobiaceae bacterium]|tara:strand:- start:5068 stop:6096 length:1029 start_codon:yes stop_codon:yes gene_type:complete